MGVHRLTVVAEFCAPVFPLAAIANIRCALFGTYREIAIQGALSSHNLMPMTHDVHDVLVRMYTGLATSNFSQTSTSSTCYCTTLGFGSGLYREGVVRYASLKLMPNFGNPSVAVSECRKNRSAEVHKRKSGRSVNEVR